MMNQSYTGVDWYPGKAFREEDKKRTPKDASLLCRICILQKVDQWKWWRDIVELLQNHAAIEIWEEPSSLLIW